MKSAVALALLAGSAAASNSSCRCFPGDSCWPSTSSWDSLNSTVGGRLVKTLPLGAVCHDPHYDEAACQDLRDNWTAPQIHEPSSSSVMSPYFANQSCDPFTDRARPCELGNYVRYAVNVTSASDVSAALAFAKKKNLRVVVRNTGHDFLGRSTGAGSLGIWMHHLKNITKLEWSDSSFTGTAFKMGAGVLGYEATAATGAEGRLVITGECPTVGVAGGYTQGGGHGALSSQFGLAADQVLEWEVVTADGVLRRANRQENSDLFWALSGGGGGTFGVVMSVTVRSYEDAPIAGLGLQMSAAYTTQDNWYKIIAAFNQLVPQMTAKKAMVVYYFNNAVMVINPVTLYNGTVAQIEDMMAPWFNMLANMSVPYSKTAVVSPSNYAHYNTWMGPLPYGHVEVSAYQFGSRLLDTDTIAHNNDNLTAALRYITSNGGLAVGSAVHAQPPAGVALSDNAVLPAWRTSGVHMQITTAWNNTPSAWDTMLENQAVMTDDFVPRLNAVTPKSGTYMNEADFRQPTWKKDFFGDNYNRLLKIKQKYDPSNVFWSLKTVGSDAWSVDEQTGRMCRA
ncbi:hypothetical protein TD95_001252 [Thielaviopsis punctulata]|uniref:FAD-binding PCMH-type domain-containing protein n=1 Tax=Thielaviopsis punctulata TaxID=72032 RepID=A0A0F4ZAW8_9PEZI|nr:hypothetical protein TD95_001252 [Thielaviopsis punctulata]